MVQWLYDQGARSEHCLWGLAVCAVVAVVAAIVVMLSEPEE